MGKKRPILKLNFLIFEKSENFLDGVKRWSIFNFKVIKSQSRPMSHLKIIFFQPKIFKKFTIHLKIPLLKPKTFQNLKFSKKNYNPPKNPPLAPKKPILCLPCFSKFSRISAPRKPPFFQFFSKFSRFTAPRNPPFSNFFEIFETFKPSFFNFFEIFEYFGAAKPPFFQLFRNFQDFLRPDYPLFFIFSKFSRFSAP